MSQVVRGWSIKQIGGGGGRIGGVHALFFCFLFFFCVWMPGGARGQTGGGGHDITKISWHFCEDSCFCSCMIQPMFALLPTQNEYLEASKLKDKFTPKCKKISHYLLKLMESQVQVFFSKSRNHLWSFSGENSVARFSWTAEVDGDFFKRLKKIYLNNNKMAPYSFLSM